MTTTETRQHIHKLVDEATGDTLDAVLEILEPSTNYTKEELNIIYERDKQYQLGKVKPQTLEESRQFIFDKLKQNGL